MELQGILKFISNNKQYNKMLLTTKGNIHNFQIKFSMLKGFGHLAQLSGAKFQ